MIEKGKFIHLENFVDSMWKAWLWILEHPCGLEIIPRHHKKCKFAKLWNQISHMRIIVPTSSLIVQMIFILQNLCLYNYYKLKVSHGSEVWEKMVFTIEIFHFWQPIIMAAVISEICVQFSKTSTFHTQKVSMRSRRGFAF